MNLQLFAKKPTLMVNLTDGNDGTVKKNTNKTTTYDPYSIVDYLKSQGKDSSYSARAQLANQYGISNYSGTANQNTTLLNYLKNGTGTTANKSTTTSKPVTNTTTNTTSNTVNNTTAPEVSKVNGVDSSILDKILSGFTPSDTLDDAYGLSDEFLNGLISMPSPSISGSTLGILNSSFQASSAYKEAMAFTNSLLEKLSSGRTSYTDQVKAMMDKIQNREKFSYDVDNDTLFQQALASAMGSGKQAMQDTIGQASALTGGYASTYATSAGNQAYNAYIEDAYNNLPEYYQMAMEAYNMEGQEMYNQLAMLNEADANEYNRLYNSWNANFTNAQNMYNQEYTAWQDSVNNAFNSASLELQQQNMAYNQMLNKYNAVQDNANNRYNQEYQKWQDSVNTALNYAGMQNSDYWNTLDYIENQREFDANNQYRYDALANDNYWNAVDNQYRYDSLAQDQSQFTSRYDLNGDGVVDSKDTMIENSSRASSGNSSSKATLTNRELNTLESLYKNAGGGEKGFESVTNYLEEIGKSETDFAELDILLGNADEELEIEKTEASKPWNREWSITDDTYNGGLLGLPIWKGVDHDDVFTSGDESYTYDDLEALLEESDLTEKEKKEFLKKLSAQSKN